MSFYELIGPVIGVVGTLAGAWLGGAISTKAADRVAVRQGYARLAAAFSEELARLKTSTEGDKAFAFELLRASYRKHLIAYIELKAILNLRDQIILENMWKTYTQEDSRMECSEKEIYRFSYLLQEGQSACDMRNLAIKHIEALIHEKR